SPMLWYITMMTRADNRLLIARLIRPNVIGRDRLISSLRFQGPVGNQEFVLGIMGLQLGRAKFFRRQSVQKSNCCHEISKSFYSDITRRKDFLEKSSGR